MGLFDKNSAKIDLAKILTADEVNLVIRTLLSQSSSLQTIQLAGDISSGKRTCITKAERDLIRSYINDMIDRLKPVSFFGQNAEHLKTLTSVLGKL